VYILPVILELFQRRDCEEERLRKLEVIVALTFGWIVRSWHPSIDIIIEIAVLELTAFT
jgi:hypothetical protein